MADPKIVTPLDHLLATLNNPLVGQARRDRAAECLLPFLHPKLSAVMTSSVNGQGDGNNNERPLIPYSVPRGSSIDLKTGEIIFPPGVEPEPLVPFEATHDWTVTAALTDQRDQQELVVEHLEVHAVDVSNVTRLHRRDDDRDGGPNAA
jgi:hypothetical protein